MTYQEAQAQFATIVQKIIPGLAPAALVQILTDLQNLTFATPNTAEFDPIRDAIADFVPRLQGQITQAVVNDLQSRTASLNAITALLTRTATEAAADARNLQFQKPQLIAAALKNSIATAQQLRAAAKSGDVAQTLEKAQALLVLLSQAQATIAS